MSRGWVILAIAVAVYGCGQSEEIPNNAPPELVQRVAKPEPAPLPGPTPPAGSALASSAVTETAVYILGKPKRSPRAVFARVLRRSKLGIRLVKDATKTKQRPVVEVHEPPIDKYQPPSLYALKYKGVGVSKTEAEALQKSKRVLMLRFYATGRDAVAVHRTAYTLTAMTAKQLGGLPWDEATRQVFGRKAFASRLEAWKGRSLDVERTVTLHSYRNGDAIRVISLGMGKLGLPDVVVEQLPRTFVVDAANAIRLVQQTLFEGGQLDARGRLVVSVDDIVDERAKQRFQKRRGKAPEKRTRLQLVVAKPEQGDPDNRLWRIAFPGSGTLAERQASLFLRLWGDKGAVQWIQPDKPELIAASKRARAALMKLKPHIVKGMLPREKLIVKAPFDTDDNRIEWMWVEVRSWKGTTLEGVLTNKPHNVSRLRLGASVRVQEGRLFDYIFTREDGTEEGGETNKILARQRQ